MRSDTPSAWDERGTLMAVLDYAHGTVRAKCAGLSDEHARAAPIATSPLMSISGLVSHLHWVDYFWFQVQFLGEEDQGPWTAEDPDREMHYRLDVPIVDQLDEYDAQFAGYRALIAATELDAFSQRPARGEKPVTMRWILLHLIEETARHNGHIDLLRELADGVTGY